jgi:ribosome-binding factor A
MGHKRPERVAGLVHSELSRLLREEVSDPRVGSVSITGVRLTPDLKRAMVRVLPLGGEGDHRAVLVGLEAAAGYLRGRVGRNLKLRYAPALIFELDEGLEDAVRMTHLLNHLIPDEGGEE